MSWRIGFRHWQQRAWDQLERVLQVLDLEVVEVALGRPGMLVDMKRCSFATGQPARLSLFRSVERQTKQVSVSPDESPQKHENGSEASSHTISGHFGKIALCRIIVGHFDHLDWALELQTSMRSCNRSRRPLTVRSVQSLDEAGPTALCEPPVP
jgi:hypothetical protein